MNNIENEIISRIPSISDSIRINPYSTGNLEKRIKKQAEMERYGQPLENVLYRSGSHRLI